MRCITTGLSVSYAYKKGCRCLSCRKNKSRYTKNEGEKARERVRQWVKENPERNRVHQKRYVDKTWLNAYGELNARQKGRCAICKKKPQGMSNSRERLSVDHNHETGKIRGLLCGSCNIGLGNFCDSQRLLGSAIQYLNSYE